MTQTNFFFDSYAFFEIIHGNEAYDKYVTSATPVTTLWNLYEMHYHLLNRFGEQVANDHLALFSEYCTEITHEDITNASQFRIKNRQKKISYVDALGYVMGMRRGMKFLTGDKAFEDMPNVEYVR